MVPMADCFCLDAHVACLHKDHHLLTPLTFHYCPEKMSSFVTVTTLFLCWKERGRSFTPQAKTSYIQRLPRPPGNSSFLHTSHWFQGPWFWDRLIFQGCSCSHLFTKAEAVINPGLCAAVAAAGFSRIPVIDRDQMNPKKQLLGKLEQPNTFQNLKC